MRVDFHLEPQLEKLKREQCKVFSEEVWFEIERQQGRTYSVNQGTYGVTFAVSSGDIAFKDAIHITWDAVDF